MKNFFRGQAGTYSFKIFGLSHIVILFFIILALYYFLKNRNNIEIVKLVRSLSINILIIQQILLYTWYIFSGYFSLGESLPFYNCRIAMLSLILGEIYDKDLLKRIGVYWGIPGAIIALMYPILDPFGYDHFTFYSFFLGHIALLFASISILSLEGYIDYYSKKTLKNILFFSTIYHFFIIKFNSFVDSNYCYMNSSPISLRFIENISDNTYHILALVTFDIIIIISSLGVRNFCLKIDRNKLIS